MRLNLHFPWWLSGRLGSSSSSSSSTWLEAPQGCSTVDMAATWLWPTSAMVRCFGPGLCFTSASRNDKVADFGAQGCSVQGQIRTTLSPYIVIVQPEVLHRILHDQNRCCLQLTLDIVMLSVLQGWLGRSSCMLSLAAHHGVGSQASGRRWGLVFTCTLEPEVLTASSGLLREHRLCQACSLQVKLLGPLQVRSAAHCAALCTCETVRHIVTWSQLQPLAE